MKKVLVAITIICTFAFAGNVLAEKETVFHCGCNSDGTDLVWVELNINENSKGHQWHNDTDPEDCYDELDVYVDTYVRDFDDCEEADGPDVDGVDNCYSVGVTKDFCYDSDSLCFDVGDSCAD